MFVQKGIACVWHWRNRARTNLLFAFLVFGPDKLPGMGRTLGRYLRQFKTLKGFNKVVRADLLDLQRMHFTLKHSEQLKNAASDADRKGYRSPGRPLLSVVLVSEEREAAEKAAAEKAESKASKLNRPRRLSRPEAASADEAPASALQTTSSVAAPMIPQVTEHSGT